jgi:hypothetical protein
MKFCPACGTNNRENAQFCEECGSRFPAVAFAAEPAQVELLQATDQLASGESPQKSSVTSVGVPAIPESNGLVVSPSSEIDQAPVAAGVHAMLIIERGGAASSEFPLTAEESQIGRWDADNGIFPDVDLDAHDTDAKVSRRHARVIYRNGVHMVEDLGSTNGTFVNRGRRLLPGNPQVLTDGDEIIVGKTFLRFCLK